MQAIAMTPKRARDMAEAYACNVTMRDVAEAYGYASRVNSCIGKMGKAVAEAPVSAGFQLVPVSCSAMEVPDGKIEVCDREICIHDPSESEKTLASIVKEYPDLIVVDYTVPDAVNANAELYCKLGLPFVMGTTGGNRQLLHKTVHDANNYAVISPQMGKQVLMKQKIAKEKGYSDVLTLDDINLEEEISYISVLRDTQKWMDVSAGTLIEKRAGRNLPYPLAAAGHNSVSNPDGVEEPACDLLLDSGASKHVVGDRRMLQGYQSLSKPWKIKIADGNFLDVIGIGTIRHGNFIIPNVHHVVGLEGILISVGQLDTDHGLGISFHKGQCVIRDADGKNVIGRGTLKDNGVYLLSSLCVPATIEPDEESPATDEEPMEANNEGANNEAQGNSEATVAGSRSKRAKKFNPRVHGPEWVN